MRTQVFSLQMANRIAFAVALYESRAGCCLQLSAHPYSELVNLFRTGGGGGPCVSVFEWTHPSEINKPTGQVVAMASGTHPAKAFSMALAERDKCVAVVLLASKAK